MLKVIAFNIKLFVFFLNFHNLLMNFFLKVLNKKVKIFGFFYSEKVIFHKIKKNSIIVQQKEELAIYTIRDDNGRVWDWAVSSRSGSFIFFNSQTRFI